jgi:hypothetical protein
MSILQTKAFSLFRVEKMPHVRTGRVFINSARGERANFGAENYELNN